MIKKSQQINKGKVKDQTNKSEPKKKVVNKKIVWECLSCRKRVISEDRPMHCSCSQENYVVNNNYTVKE